MPQAKAKPSQSQRVRGKSEIDDLFSRLMTLYQPGPFPPLSLPMFQGAEVPVLERLIVVVAVFDPGVAERASQPAAAWTVNVTGVPAVAVPKGETGLSVTQAAGRLPAVFRPNTFPPVAVELTETVCAGPGK